MARSIVLAMLGRSGSPAAPSPGHGAGAMAQWGCTDPEAAGSGAARSGSCSRPTTAGTVEGRAQGELGWAVASLGVTATLALCFFQRLTSLS